MKSRTSIAMIAGLLLSAVATSLHAQGYRVAPPRSATFPLERYSASLGVGTPAGELRTRWYPDSLVARLQREAIVAMLASAPSTARVPAAAAVDSQLSAPLPACPMPVVMRDSASVPPMPVLQMEPRAGAVGTIVGCQNTLRPVK